MPSRSRKNNDDDMDPEDSSSEAPTMPTSYSRRQRNEALAIMLGRLSALTKNPTTPLFVDTSMDNDIKIEEESPTGTATTASLSTIESEHRLALSRTRTPQSANTLQSPSYQLPSPTDESPKNTVQVTFAQKFSNMFDITDDDEAPVLDAIDEENDCREEMKNHNSLKFQQAEKSQDSINSKITIAKDMIRSPGANSEDQVNSTTEPQGRGSNHVPMVEEMGVSEDQHARRETIEPESDPFMAIRLGQLQMVDRKGGSLPAKSPGTADRSEENDENEGGLIEDQSVQSENTEKTYESKISRFSYTQEVLNSPMLNSPIVSTVEHRNKNVEEHSSKSCSPYSKDVMDSPASLVSYHSMSAPMARSENQDHISPEQAKNQLSPNDTFTGSRLSMAGEIEVLGNQMIDESAIGSYLDPYQTNRQRELQISGQEGRPPLVPILLKSKEPLMTISSDWDNDMDPIDFIRNRNAITEGRKKKCGRYKTWQAVRERLQELCPDEMNWDGLDPVLVDRYYDSQEFHIESKEGGPPQTSDPIMDHSRHKTREMVQLRLQQSSPSDSDWHEKDQEFAEVDDGQSKKEEAPSSVRTEPSNQEEYSNQDITLRTIRMQYKHVQGNNTAWESRLDKYSDETDGDYYCDDHHGDDHDEQNPSFPSQYSPMVSQALGSTNRWYQKSGALPQLSYQGSGPFDFDEVFENTYHKAQTLQSNMHIRFNANAVYLLQKERGQSIGVYLRKFKRQHGIYIESLDPNGLVCRTAAANAASEFRTSRRSTFSASKRGTRISSSTPVSTISSAGRLIPGMKIEMINGRPCPWDLQLKYPKKEKGANDDNKLPSVIEELPVEVKRRIASFLPARDLLKLSETSKRLKKDLDVVVVSSPLTDRASQNKVIETGGATRCFAVVIPNQEEPQPHQTTFTLDVVSLYADELILIVEQKLPETKSGDLPKSHPVLKCRPFNRGKVVTTGIATNGKVHLSFFPKTGKFYQFWVNTTPSTETGQVYFQNMMLHHVGLATKPSSHSAFQFEVRHETTRRSLGLVR